MRQGSEKKGKSLGLGILLMLTYFFVQNSLAGGAEEINWDRATALSTVLFAPIEVHSSFKRKDIGQEQIAEFQKMLTQQLTENSRLKVRAGTESILANSKKELLREIARREKVDGFILGTLGRNQLRVSLRSGTSGHVLSRWIFSLPKKMTAKSVELFVQEVVGDIVNTVPYQAYVQDVEGQEARLSVGKISGFKPGEIYPMFRFQGERANFSSQKENLGEVQVVEVGKAGAKVRLYEGDVILPYAKIGYEREDDSTSARYRHPRGGWGRVGWEVVSLDTEFSDRILAARNYDLNFTPFLFISGGLDEWAVTAQWGVADSSLNEVQFVFLSLLKTWKVWGTSKFSYSLAAGLSARAFSAREKIASSKSLESSGGWSPLLDGRWTWVRKRKTQIFLGHALQALIFEKGGDASTAAASFGLGVYGGTKIDLSTGLSIEAGVRAQYSHLELLENFTINETQLGLFSRALLAF